MSNLKEIQSRIMSLQATSKITTAMKMIAITKYRRASQGFSAIHQFVENFKETTKYVPYVIQGDKKYLIVFAPEKGLCGSLNTKMNRFLASYRDYEIIVMGKIKYHGEFTTVTSIEALISHLISYQEIKLVYINFESPSKNNIQEEVLFPWACEQDYQVIIELEDFNTWFKDYLHQSLYHAFSSSQISEHASRMLAMDIASRNAKDLIQDLKLSYNKQRQASITKEILETGVSIYGE